MKKKKWQKGLICLLTASLVLLSFGNREKKETAVSSNSINEIQKKVALTFDDGPDGRYTAILLDGLKERNVKATFFVTGKKAEEFPTLIKRMHLEGHLIGNHTYSHMQLLKGKEEEFKQELQKTSEIIETLIGENTEFVRPPYGVWEKRFEEELNMFPVLWTVEAIELKIGGKKSSSKHEKILIQTLKIAY